MHPFKSYSRDECFVYSRVECLTVFDIMSMGVIEDLHNSVFHKKYMENYIYIFTFFLFF